MATAAGAFILPSNGLGKATRKSYAREFNLNVVNHYHDNNSDAQSLNTKTILYVWCPQMMLS